MRPVFDDDHWEVAIQWSRPTPLESFGDGYSEPDNALLYMVIAKAPRGAHKGIYIGQAYSQNIAVRVRQPDHRTKQELWHQAWPRHRLMISVGTIKLKNGGQVGLKKVTDLENILIYCFDNEHCRNVKSKSTLAVRDHYLIRNSGFRSSDLPR